MRVHLLEFNVVLQEDLDLFAEVEFLLEQEDAQEGVVQAVGRDLVAHVAVADEREVAHGHEGAEFTGHVREVVVAEVTHVQRRAAGHGCREADQAVVVRHQVFQHVALPNFLWDHLYLVELALKFAEAPQVADPLR